MAGKLILCRHGESEWNLENIFTGWVDVDLSQKGEEEAKEAGITLKNEGLSFDLAYTSVLKRATKTLWIMLEEMELTWFAKIVRPIPLALILVGVIVVAVIASLGIGNNDDSNRSVPVVKPTDPVLGCMNLGTGSQGIRVACVSGEFDATIYRIVTAGEECPNDLEAVYAGNEEMFCVFYEDKPS